VPIACPSHNPLPAQPAPVKSWGFSLNASANTGGPALPPLQPACATRMRMAPLSPSLACELERGLPL
jgi:hypothetical protein